MYRRILVPLEHSPADEAILRHVRPLAKLSGASLVLLHVADGWVARNIRQLDLRESEEMREDRAYLEQVGATLRAEGFDTDAVLAAGDPPKEIPEASGRAAARARACAKSRARPTTPRSSAADAAGTT